TPFLALTPFEGFEALILSFSLAIGFLRLLVARLMTEGMVGGCLSGTGGLGKPADARKTEGKSAYRTRAERLPGSSLAATRSCFMVSRSRTVTVPSCR